MIDNEVEAGGAAASGSFGVFTLNYGPAVFSNNIIAAGAGLTGSFGAYSYSMGPGLETTFVGNEIAGGDATGNTYGLVQYHGAAHFFDNRLDGGMSTSTSTYGFVFLGEGTPVLDANVAAGGESPTSSYGGVLSFESANPFFLSNNVFDGADGTAASFGAAFMHESPGGVIANNTFLAGAGSASSFGVQFDAYSAAPNPTTWFINNIVDGGGGTAASIAFVEDSGADFSELRFYNNNFRADLGATTGCLLYDSDATDCLDAIGDVNDGDWYNCGTADGNMTVPHGLANPGAGDYHLTAASALIDAGVNPFILYDGPFSDFFWFDFEQDVRPRGEGWDIGADEFVPAP
ncbi:MAG: hypothetical protein M5R36_27700 [Deltaproteobacteria bacterium]|nr:hypothetical protein [Deltaproteobacteria bacterium]